MKLQWKKSCLMWLFNGLQALRETLGEDVVSKAASCPAGSIV